MLKRQFFIPADTVALYFLVGFGCFFISLLLSHFFAKNWFGAWALDDPETESRRIHSIAKSRLGGLAIFLPTILALLVVRPGGVGFIYPTVACFSVIFLIGLVDDFVSLSGRLRLVLQAATSFILCSITWSQPFFIRLSTHIGFELPIGLSWCFGAFVLVGAIQATNLKDGLDGLAGGLVLIALFFLGLIDIHANDSYSAFVFSGPLIFSLAGFLKNNSYPAKIFMGDGGSNFIGFFVGFLFLTLIAGEGFNQAPNFIAVLGCFALPIVDAGRVLVARVFRGNSIFRADNLHSHHLLLSRGFSHSSAVLAEYFFGAFFAFLAVASVAYNHTQKPVVAIFSLTCFCLFIVHSMRSLKLVRAFFSLMRNVKLQYFISSIVQFISVLVMSSLLVTIDSASFYQSLLALSLSLCLVPIFFLPDNSHDFYSKFVVLVCCIFLVISVNQVPLNIVWGEDLLQLQFLYNLFYFVLSGLVILLLCAKFSSNSFSTHPEDVLLVFAPTLLLFLPKDLRVEHHLVVVALRAFFLFLAFRLVIQKGKIMLGPRHALFAILLIYGGMTLF